MFSIILKNARDRSLSPRRRSSNDPLSIPGYREARDRYRDENPDSSGHRHYDEIPPKKSRPEYEFSPMSHKPYPPPAVGKPVEAPIDCEIIIIHKQQMYVDSISIVLIFRFHSYLLILFLRVIKGLFLFCLQGLCRVS